MLSLIRSRFVVMFWPILLLIPVAGDPPSRAADQAALRPFANLVGEWRGTGLKQRGSAKGAWTENASWAWNLTKDSASLRLVNTRGKHLESAILRPGAQPDTFVMEAVLAGGKTRKFAGTMSPKKSLVLLAQDVTEEGPTRITITPLHETRLLMLLESDNGKGAAERLGEVGYTRSGVVFASGDSSPVCIVTGGRGTIPVTFQGTTYHVCCSGCKDLFDEDPASVIAESKRKPSR